MAGFEDEGTLVIEEHFAIVPEWIIDADISDCAYRLYSILLRYGQSSGQRMPGRALLAKRLRKRSKDSVDRALKELVAIGAVAVERRRHGRQNLTNRYHLMATPPGVRPAGPPARRRNPASSVAGGSRTAAATPAGRNAAATDGPTPAATLAAPVRPNPGVPTQKNPPPPSPRPHPVPRTADGGGGGGGDASADSPVGGEPARPRGAVQTDDVDALATECQRLRHRLGLPTTRWTARRLTEVLDKAVSVHGWPAAAAGPALLAIAADPATNSPMRLSCPGPWWEIAERRAHPDHPDGGGVELAELEARLIELGGLRVSLQQQARHELATEGFPVNRLNVSRRACELLDGGASRHALDRYERSCAAP